MLGKRILSAAILIPVVMAVVYLGGMPFFLLVVLVAGLAGYEYLRMMSQVDLAPSYPLGMLLIVLLVADGQWPSFGLLFWVVSFVPLGLLLVQVFRGNAPGSLFGWAVTVAGGLYLGLSMGFFVRLRAIEQGMLWFVIALVGTWTCDTAAYLVGSRLGKHRFFPRISPKKTLEGAVGGVLAGMVVVTLMGWWLVGLPVGWGVLLGLLLVFGATFGDLAESVIKRQVNVKDSGSIIPGHGGMLDRVDSLLFVVPIVYAFAVIAARLSSWHG